LSKERRAPVVSIQRALHADYRPRPACTQGNFRLLFNFGRISVFCQGV
jgi:hypothetical protein